MPLRQRQLSPPRGLTAAVVRSVDANVAGSCRGGRPARLPRGTLRTWSRGAAPDSPWRGCSPRIPTDGGGRVAGGKWAPRPPHPPSLPRPPTRRRASTREAGLRGALGGGGLLPHGWCGWPAPAGQRRFRDAPMAPPVTAWRLGVASGGGVGSTSSAEPGRSCCRARTGGFGRAAREEWGLRGCASALRPSAAAPPAALVPTPPPWRNGKTGTRQKEGGAGPHSLARRQGTVHGSQGDNNPPPP